MMDKQDTKKLVELQNKYADVLSRFYDSVKELSVDKKFINCKATQELIALGDDFMEVEDGFVELILGSIKERSDARMKRLEEMKKELAE